MLKAFKPVKILNAAVSTVLEWFLLSIALYVTFEVISRYFFLNPHNYTDKLTVFLILFITLGGAGVAMAEGKHIEMSLVRSKLKGHSRKIMDAFIYTLSTVTCGLLAYFLWNYTLFLIDIGAATETTPPIPHWPAALALFIGMATATLAALQKLAELFCLSEIEKETKTRN